MPVADCGEGRCDSQSARDRGYRNHESALSFAWQSIEVAVKVICLE